MSVNSMILIGLATWILYPAATAPAPADRSLDDVDEILDGLGTDAPEPTPPTVAEILDTSGLWFGISAPEVPWSESALARLTGAAGASPTMIQFFVKWTEGYPEETVELSYQRNAVPILSWEPWAGLDSGTNQPEFALRNIIEGGFDDYLEYFADTVRDHGWPVVIRLAHEMNGTWYPWSEGNSGNQPGEFAEAWRHVHDVFDERGADNVIWLWSPNIVRPVPDVSLEGLYPGDAYVDWVGMVGYAVSEATAEEVFEETRDLLREFTDRPIIITETGAQPGPNKIGWIGDFFDWLRTRPDVAGFIWFEYDIPEGGNADWRFTATSETAAAFKDGLGRVRLAPPPLAQ